MKAIRYSLKTSYFVGFVGCFVSVWFGRCILLGIDHYIYRLQDVVLEQFPSGVLRSMMVVQYKHLKASSAALSRHKERVCCLVIFTFDAMLYSSDNGIVEAEHHAVRLTFFDGLEDCCTSPNNAFINGQIGVARETSYLRRNRP